MSETLYPYYERELLFIRQMAQEFARAYPGAASRLMLEPNRSVDPHVERMIQGFALLTARIQHKLDDEFPELTEALFNILFPHYLAPVPSMAVVEFDLDAQRGPLPTGFHIPRFSRLRTPPINDVSCQYRTAYPTALWPIKVSQAQILQPPFPTGLKAPPGTACLLLLRLDCQSGLNFSQLTLNKLRFYLNGDNYVVGNLYELLFNNCLSMLVRPVEPETKPVPLVLNPKENLFQVGFEEDEGLFPFPRRSFTGYRLLTEFFAFPQKFLFVDLGGFARIRQAGFGKRLEIIFFLNRNIASLQQAVEPGIFRLGCTPIVNLFERTAEPISLSQTKSEYLVLPDVATPFGMEVYSVDSVLCTNPDTGKTEDCHPFYSFRHNIPAEEQNLFWYAHRRRSSHTEDKGTDVFLTLVDRDFRPTQRANSTLALRVTCTNRQLPYLLQRFAENLPLDLEGAAPLNQVRCLNRPSLPLQPPLRRGAYWRLISHLSLNHLSITDGEEGRQALQEILTLYSFSDPEKGDQQAAIHRNIIEGITNVASRRVVGRTSSRGICQGVEIALEFDEQKYVGTGIYLFASILERFFGTYASLNSFTQLVTRVKQREGILKKWPPRAGAKHLV